MNRKIGSKFCIALLVAAILVALGMPAEAQRAPRPAAPLPVVRAYELWVNQGIRSGRFVRRCTLDNLEGVSYPAVLPPTIKRDGQKTVYGDINNDGVTDFIAQVWSIDCEDGHALWNGEFLVGISQGSDFRFVRWGDSLYTRFLGPIHGPTSSYGLLLEITSIRNGLISGVFIAEDSYIRGRCEGYRGWSNVRRSFTFDAMRGQMVVLGAPVIDREWRCF